MDGERSTKLTQLSVTYLRIMSMIIGRYLTINTKEREPHSECLEN